MLILQPAQLKALYRAVILELGGTLDEAGTFADFLVLADLRGMDWQGIKSLDKHYVWSIQEGIIKLGQEIAVVSEGPAHLMLDAGGELGQVTCARVMNSAIQKAKSAGVALGAVQRSGDTGLLGSYTVMAIAHDCIGVMFNATAPYVAPWGGTERTHGIDPLSVAIPAGREYPILLDMSLTEAQTFFDQDGRWERPFPPPPVMSFATMREYAMTVVVELISGALTNTPVGCERVHRGETGVIALAIHIPHFIDVKVFKDQVDSYVRQVKTTTRAVESEEVLLPGERGFREAERRSKSGVPVPDDVWASTVRLMESIGVDWQGALDAPQERDVGTGIDAPSAES